jgi:glutamate/aspartate transport system substrate-binding protein
LKKAILALACLGMCAVAQAQSNDTLKKITDSGKMVVAYRESSVPFSYLDGTKPIGFSEELTAHVVKAVQD